MSDFQDAFMTMPVGFWYAFIGLLGLCIGSFANVIIHRWPAEESIVHPRSRCPQCKTPLKFYDNIPVISWILLRGKCRACGAAISSRYMFVELLTGVLFVSVFYVHGFSWLTLEYLIFVSGIVPASFIDIDHYLLPDVITIPGMLLALGGAFLNPERSFWEALMGVLFGGGFLWLIAYVYFALRKVEGMGGGDIKLLAWIGALLGWTAVPFVILLSALTGSILGLALGLSQKKGLKTVIPFGPYLAFSTLVCILGGTDWARTYLHWFIPEI